MSLRVTILIPAKISAKTKQIARTIHAKTKSINVNKISDIIIKTDIKCFLRTLGVLLPAPRQPRAIKITAVR